MAEPAPVIAITVPASARLALSLASLTADAADILRCNADLPQPAAVSVDDSQRIELVFDPDPASYPALTAWARKHGGTLTSQRWHTHAGPPANICRVQFPYHDAEVIAFAVIPAEPATT